MTLTENFERFQYFETSFLKNENLFQKTRVELHFSVESTKIENALFLYKTALSEAMLRQIEWEIQNRQKTEFFQELP